jgi:hypothetical protein
MASGVQSYHAALSYMYKCCLQELVAAVGWDTFLEMRARVFVMHEGEASKKQAAQKQVRLIR